MASLLGDWSTYALSDFLLFSPRTYYRLFEIYNAAIWPAQLVALAAGAVVLHLAASGGPRSRRAAVAILGAAWLWLAFAFHLERYATILWLAPGFAAAFAVQAALLTGVAAIGETLPTSGPPVAPARWRSRIAWGLVAFGVVVLPLAGPLLLDRPWRQIELFGVAPDPTVIASLGILVAGGRGARRSLLLAVPLLWCLITGLTLRAMGAADFWAAPAAALVTVGILIAEHRALRRR
jgi:hypothetical protein